MTEDQIVDAGARVTRFLEDEAVKAAIAALEKRYYDAFRASASPEVREAAWAKANALTDLQTELQSVVDRGTRTRAERDRRTPRGRH